MHILCIGKPEGVVSVYDILLIAHFTQIPGERGNSRFNYLAEQIVTNNDGVHVEIVTSSFSHQTKSQRKIRDNDIANLPYELVMVYEPGYERNVSVKRIWSHKQLGTGLRNYLEARKRPDIVYCAVPSLSVADVAAKYAENHRVPFIIDVQDLWPEAFRMVFSIPILTDMLYFPMKKQADYIYSSADKIVAVSQTYANRALQVNKKCRQANVVYLGTDLGEFDRFAAQSKPITKPDDEIWLAYVGTLGHSYDIKCVIDALTIVNEQFNMRFVVIGDGPLKGEFEHYAEEKGISATFTGRLDYGMMVSILVMCDMAVNPIMPGAASIINKHADYAAAGLPVLNTQECLEYRELLTEYGAGFNCENNNPEDLADKLLRLCTDRELRYAMGANSRKMAEERFDRRKTYHVIADLILGARDDG